jgi:hypothetical protein
MKRLFKHGDVAYIVITEQPVEKFGKEEPDMEYVKMYRDWLKSDHVLRTPTHFIFCETVQDIEWEDIIEDAAE